jgi:hypothetical protein
MHLIVPYIYYGPLRTSFLHQAPSYAEISTMNATDRILQCVPRFLHGMKEIVHMIRDYIGLQGVWMKVVVDLNRIIDDRHRYVYFLFSVLSKMEPISNTLYIPTQLPTERRICNQPREELASTKIPYIYNEDGSRCLYYRTRSGHFGTMAELTPVTTIIHFHGGILYHRPSKKEIMEQYGSCLIITTSPSHWEHMKSDSVIIMNYDETYDQTIIGNKTFDTIMMDNVYAFTSVLSPNQLHPSFELHGRMYPTYASWVQNKMNCNNIVQIISERKPTIDNILSCLYTIRTERNGCRLFHVNNINEYSINRASLAKTLENLFS